MLYKLKSSPRWSLLVRPSYGLQIFFLIERKPHYFIFWLNTQEDIKITKLTNWCDNASLPRLRSFIYKVIRNRACYQ